VTASVADSGRLAASAALTLTVDAKPVVVIASPQNGLSVKAATPVSFAVSAMDLEDGDLSASLVRTSSKEGMLGTGASPTRALGTTGTHVITASVADSGSSATQTQVKVRVR
jgi:chitinase